MIYDLNRIYDDVTKGRDVEVPDGVNYESITLHKVVVGGAPDDPDDRKDYPGCVLVNVPKFKVHSITLFTNVIKNLGIGLYPMQSNGSGEHKWDYSVPHTSVPGMKGGIPHQVWVPEIDLDTGLPKRDDTGKYVVKKTGGIDATMIDIIKAVSHQGIFMLHVVDAVEAINVLHTGPGKKEPEGMVFAGLDPVATDLLCARYMFSNVPLEETLKVELDDGHEGRFPQKVPIPTVEGKNIVSRTGYDCPLSRDKSIKRAEARGLGNRKYYVVGRDRLTDSPLVSLEGHLGRADDGRFSDLITETLYYDAAKMPWDMQRTAFAYMESIDSLTDSSLKKEFLEAFDEDSDGIVSYDDFGKKGIWGPLLYQGGIRVSMVGTEEYGYIHSPFYSVANRLKCYDARWNPDGHDVMKEWSVWSTCLIAYQMSQVDDETHDPFFSGLQWGKGKWPSFELAFHMHLGISLYGSQYPAKLGFPSLYGSAFRYADLTQNEARYVGKINNQPDPEAINNYVTKVAEGNEKPLDFTFYVPADFATVGGTKVPNVEATTDPAKILTASFSGGKVTW